MGAGKLAPFLIIMTFDSPEEEYYYDWLTELKEQGYIHSIEQEPEYELFPEVKIKDKTILRCSMYKPDFIIIWEDKAKDVFYFTEESNFKSIIVELKSKHFAHKDKLTERYYSVVDVKGTFAARGNSSTIKFPIIQKQMYYRYKIYVNKIMPLHSKSGLFANTFTPKKFYYTKKGKLKTLKWKLKSLSEFTNKN
jgi:hypothetical protein